MDWTQAFTIIGIIAGFFVFMMNRIDGNQKENNKNFEAMNQRFNSLENRMTGMEAETKTELRNMNQRLATIEGYLVPRKIFHIQENDLGEELKEN